MENLKRALKISRICFCLALVCFVAMCVLCSLKDRIISRQQKLISECQESARPHQPEHPATAYALPTGTVATGNTMFLASSTSTAMLAATTNAASFLTAPPAEPPKARETKVIADLRKAAAAKRLYWQVGCTNWRDKADEQWIAFAKRPGSDGYYVEDGGRPEWIVSGKSKEDVAAKLLRALQNPPNYYPPRRGPEKPKRPCEGEDVVGGPDR